MTRTKVEICGIDTSKLPLLKHEQMKELFKRLQAGEHSLKMNWLWVIYD